MVIYVIVHDTKTLAKMIVQATQTWLAKQFKYRLGSIPQYW